MSLVRRLAIGLFRPRPARGAASPVELDAVQGLLVVRAHDQLGDFLLATPALHALRLRFPCARVTLVVNRFLAPLALQQPDVDRVLVAPWGGRGRKAPTWPELRALLRALRAERYDLALLLNTVSHSLTSDLVARLSRAPRVIGPATPALKDSPGAPLYDWAYEPGVAAGPHQMQKALAAVAPLGCPSVALSYRFELSPEEEESGRRRAAALGPGPLVALHIGTRDPAKRYPVESWARAARSTADRCRARLVLLDAPDARAAQEDLVRRLSGDLHALPPMELREVAAFLKSADLLLCHDSAVLHLAAAVATPTVSIHGRGEVAEWKPSGDAHAALQSPDHVPASIEPERVAQAAALLLERSTRPLSAETRGV